MDPTDNFFGFDASTAVDNDDAGVLLECDGDDYDAVNNETFGSAAVDGDWEENHKQFSSLTTAERLKSGRNKGTLFSENTPFRLRDLHRNEEKNNLLDGFFCGATSDHRRLFDRNNDNDEISTSPGNSIWSPTHHLEVNNFSSAENITNNIGASIKNNHLNEFTRFNSANSKDINSPNSFLGSLSEFQNIKTVDELEAELKKYQHSQHQPQLGTLGTQPNLSRLSAITVEELERQLSKQSMSPNITRQLSSTFPNFSSRSQQQNLPQSLLNGSNRSIPNQYFPSQHHSVIPTAALSRSYNGTGKNGVLFHPLLNSVHKSFSGTGPNFPNNLANHPLLNNGNRQFNQYFNRMGDNNRGFMPNGNNYQRFPNMMRNNGCDRRNYEQNFRFDQQRSFLEHNHREQNGLNSANERGMGITRERRDSDAEWEEWQRIRQEDSYAGLMTPREKSWLRSIQAMQLQTDNPYQDDYYFVMSSAKQQRRREEEVMEIDGLQMLIPDKSKEGKEYEPPRLENSLGKLQVASVNAPRKIIDLHVVHLDSSHPTTSLQRDMRKHRHLLMHIEKLYTIQIEIEDLERKIQSLQDCPTRDSFRSKFRQLVAKLWNGLVYPHESFVQILCIKKGKTLSAWLLSRVHESEAEHLLATVIQNLSMLTKKDANDKCLKLFWLVADRFFASITASSLVNFGIMMGTQLKPQKNNFVPAIESKLGLSIILALLIRGENLWSELCQDEAWLLFLKDVITGLSLCAMSADTLKLQPLPSINLTTSPKHPATQISRSKDVDATLLNLALDALKTCENFTMKDFPAYSHLHDKK